MKKLKIKDVIMIALLSALYMILYMLSMVLITPLGPFGHSIGSGLCALLTGSIFFFISRKIGKFGQFTIMQAIVMLLFGIMGAGYLPWFITSMIGSLIADFIGSRNNRTSVFIIALASGVFHVGQALGAIIPSMFFMESYRSEWISRGQTPEAMDEMIKYTSGIMGVIATIIVFALSVAGVYLGYAILRKHLDKKDVVMA
ncbi:MAG: MptD family putative ECF transporter S component [Pseudobutyrivibrio sp.]|nr:MptD family putative ECF transporter S component [Pseudobutyrivibrio sp.]